MYSLIGFDQNILFILLFGVVLVVVILLLNMVISPAMQANYLVNYMFKRTDVEGAYQDASEHSSWKQNIAVIKKATKEVEKLGYQKVTITSFDNLKLVGYVLSKKTHAKGTIILVHSCRSYALREFACLALEYYKENYNVLIIDGRAHNQSEGDFMTYGVYEHKDLLMWIDFIDNYFEKQYNIYLHGSDMGAIVVSMVADKVDPSKVKGLILESPFTNGRSLFSKFVFQNGKFKNIAQVLKFTYRKAKRKYGINLDDINPEDCLINTSIPSLFIIGSADQYGNNDCDALYQECSSEYKKMLVINGATHGESYYRDNKKYMEYVNELLKEGN